MSDAMASTVRRGLGPALYTIPGVGELDVVDDGQQVILRNFRPPTPGCPGDIDDDDTDVFDFAELANAFGTSPGAPAWNPEADLASNGTIAVFDFAVLAEDFGCGS